MDKKLESLYLFEENNIKKENLITLTLFNLEKYLKEFNYSKVILYNHNKPNDS